jgi:hypothetical protein
MLKLSIPLSMLPTTAFAHPGHGHTAPGSWTHYLTEPVHVAAVAAAAVVVIGGAAVWRRLRGAADGS